MTDGYSSLDSAYHPKWRLPIYYSQILFSFTPNLQSRAKTWPGCMRSRLLLSSLHRSESFSNRPCPCLSNKFRLPLRKKAGSGANQPHQRRSNLCRCATSRHMHLLLHIQPCAWRRQDQPRNQPAEPSAAVLAPRLGAFALGATRSRAPPPPCPISMCSRAQSRVPGFNRGHDVRDRTAVASNGRGGPPPPPRTRQGQGTNPRSNRSDPSRDSAGS